MLRLKTRSRIDADGSLALQLATGLPESEVDVLVVVEPISGPTQQGVGGEPAPSLRDLYGCLADDPLERPEQGEVEQRQALR